MAKDYKVDGVIAEVLPYCAPLENDKPWLKKEMVRRGLPVLELELEYCERPSGQMKTRVEAFLEMLHNKATATAA
jgi:benzoyl-CoA reductase/2-hydroxyglutaryl-CoA dehydratase subunit BcrC/BadD/HgdB